MPPLVHVGPEAEERFVAAVREGGAEVAADPAEADAVVWLAGDPAALRAVLHPGVRWVQLQSAGVEEWLANGVVDEDRTWTSAAGAYGETVADHALALLIAGRRRLAECARAERWDAELAGRPLFGATVAIVGAGGIGRALIALLAPWHCHVIAVTRSGREVEGAAECVAAGELERVWPRAEIAVIAAPATDATARLVGTEQLAALPPGAWLVNVARGSLVDTDALVDALAAGRLGGAALDVTDPEPLPEGHPLWREPRALITPHAANPTEARLRALADFTRANVARFARGEELRGIIDTGRGY
jgi:D-3-phosphoglycerate dehydrogenase